MSVANAELKKEATKLARLRQNKEQYNEMVMNRAELDGSKDIKDALAL